MTDEDAPPTLAELVDELDAARAHWHDTRQATADAGRRLSDAMRAQVLAEQRFRAAQQRYDAERRQART